MALNEVVHVDVHDGGLDRETYNGLISLTGLYLIESHNL